MQSLRKKKTLARLIKTYDIHFHVVLARFTVAKTPLGFTVFLHTESGATWAKVVPPPPSPNSTVAAFDSQPPVGGVRGRKPCRDMGEGETMAATVVNVNS